MEAIPISKVHNLSLGSVQKECRTQAYQEQTNIVQPALFQSTYVYCRHSKLHAGTASCIVLMLRTAKVQ